MNLPELKNNFYKRLGPSDNFLYFTSNGFLCSLLGYDNIVSAPFIGCTLSMGIKMFARKLNGDMIIIQDNAKSKAISYKYGTNISQYTGEPKETIELLQRFEGRHINGAEILFDCSIPEFLPYKDTLFLTLTQSVLKISNIESDPLEIACIAAGRENISPYMGMIYSKKGYCTHIYGRVPQNLPLPMSGYKILTAHCTESERSHSKEINYALEHIRRLYPHIGSISDITPEMLQAAKNSVKNKTALRYLYHLVNENERMAIASKALKRCDIQGLFTQMNLSQMSMERFWDLGSEHTFLARCSKNIDGIEAVRCWKNGIVAITRNDKIDHAITMIKCAFETHIGYQPTFCVCDVF